MCLALPGKIISFKKNLAQVDFNGTKREVSIDLVPEAKKNDYVLVHAGFAISILSNQEAKETLNIFSEIYNIKEEKNNDPTTSSGRKTASKKHQSKIDEEVVG